MSGEAFKSVEEVLAREGPAAGFDFLAERFRAEKNYPMLFETRLMKARRELGLPLILTGPASELPEDKLTAYEQATVEAAREAGELFLADGDIARCWPYYRAIGEAKPVFEAIDKIAPNEAADGVMEVAFNEQVHPRKGFEMILERQGICRAITCFSQYPPSDSRAAAAALLTRTLYNELAGNLKRVIAEREGEDPATNRVVELIKDRDWLFEGHNYYIDTSHVTSVVQMSVEWEDRDVLALVIELTDYGKRLSEMFQHPGNPPFENLFEDHGAYLRALAGENADEAVEHFRAKIADSDPEQVGTAPAQTLVKLLVRLKRFSEAADVFLEHLADADPAYLSCPNVLQLCELAGDYKRLGEIARERGDLLSYAAAAMRA